MAEQRPVDRRNFLKSAAVTGAAAIAELRSLLSSRRTHRQVVSIHQAPAVEE